jgi:ribosomal protein S18 acetylase RimI-like enzyme
VAGDRLHMLKTWTDPAPAVPAPEHIKVRELTRADEPALAQLMMDSFVGQGEDEYPTLADAAADAQKILSDSWGPVVWPASLAAERDGAIVAAVIVIRDDAHEDRLLLAYAMVAPGSQRQGLGALLITASERHLHAAGHRELHLYVLRTNPAQALYQRLGYQFVPPADPPAPSGEVHER